MTNIAADTSTTGVVTLGTPLNGEVETQNDRDWYAVTLEAGVSYAATLFGDDEAEQRLSDPFLRIRDSDGVRVASNDDFLGLESGLTYTPDVTGTYYVDAGHLGSGTGSYVLSIGIGDNPSALFPIDGTLVLDVPLAATASAGSLDRDFFAATLEAGQVYFVDVPEVISEFGFNTITLLSPSGQTDFLGDIFGDQQRLGFAVDEDGDYTLGVTLDTFGIDEDVEYTVILSEGPEDIPGGTATEVDLELDTPVASNFFSFDDSDSFNLDLNEGQVYILDVDIVLDFIGASVVVDNAADPFSGDAFFGDVFSDSDSSLFFQANAGQNLLTLSAFGQSDYTVTLSEADIPADIGGTPDTAGFLGFAEPVIGRFEGDFDEDFYAIELVVGTSYRLTLAPEGRGNFGPSRGPVLSVVDEDGNNVSGPMGFFDGSFRTPVFTAPESGTFFAVVEGGDIRDFNPDFDPDYSLFIEDGTPVNETGTEGADTLIGGLAPDALDGAGGDDVIQAGDGADTILGGDGNDSIAASDGNDSVEGGAGDDEVGGGRGNDTVFGGDGEDRVLAGQGNDLLVGGDGIDRLWGGEGRDQIFGGADGDFIGAGRGRDVVFAGMGDDEIGAGREADIVFGGAGNDSIYGGSGNDTLYGGIGDDLMQGGFGSNVLDGGLGDDTMRGEFSDDTFVFTALTDGEVDVILDFDGFDDAIVLDLDGEPDPETLPAFYAGIELTFTDVGVIAVIQGHTIEIEGFRVDESNFDISNFLVI